MAEASIWEQIWGPVYIVLKIIAILAPLMLAVAYLTYAERKIIGYL
jgi:NADH-quinone oxidoreductase subunit H